MQGSFNTVICCNLTIWSLKQLPSLPDRNNLWIERKTSLGYISFHPFPAQFKKILMVRLLEQVHSSS